MSESILTAVIFTYNHQGSIAQCIESVVHQKTEYPYEIHLCDDCSIDGTTEICREYAEKYPDKIKFFPQAENSFLKPYDQTQSYAAIQRVSTKYFCTIDGDDSWCDENKLQTALNFLEKNSQYIGFAHDVLEVNKFSNKEQSYIHGVLAIDNIENPVTFSAKAPFFLSPSRVFRNVGFKEKNIWPVDYLVYYYHLNKGPIYYHDQMMAVYNIGKNNTFANMSTKEIQDLNGMFYYKLSLLFNFQEDDFCTKMQRSHDVVNGVGESRANRLCFFKKVFGMKWGWTLWFFFTFVFKYGFESMNLNYIYPRKKIKKRADRRVENV